VSLRGVIVTINPIRRGGTKSFVAERECGRGLRAASALRMSPDESPENGREELTFPAPWKLPVFESWRVQGQCHRLPRQGSFLAEVTTGKSGGERSPCGPARIRRAQPIAKPSYAGASRLTGAKANTVGHRPDVATVSQCGGDGVPRLMDETTRSRNPAGVAAGRGKRDPAIAE